MRQVVRLPVALVVAVVGVGLPAAQALAQSEGGSAGSGGRGYKPLPLNLRKEQLGGSELPAIGRSRMRSGDYDGALQAFDGALRTLTDPTIFRDRGLCHEKLGHVYPAIDDYRVYLTEEPEAPDAEGIARRLQALEDSVAGREPRASTNDDDTPPDLKATASVHGKVGARAGSSGGSIGVATDGQGTTASDKLEYVEPDEDAIHTPLRGGKGFSVAPFFSEHKWLGGTAFQNANDGQTWSEAFGLQVRYALGASGAVVGEIGYEYFNTTSVDAVQISGLTSLLGYEFRVPLDPAYDNQLLVVPELGYEHLTVSFVDAMAPSQNVGAFVPRIRFGWRHMLAAATALDVSLDGGAGSFFTYDKFPFDSNTTASGVVTLNLSVAWGL
jgi:hypothetical protein